MRPASTCPSREELARLMSGETSETDAAVLEEHVGQCQHCLHTTRELHSANDTLVEALRESGKAPAPRDEVAERLIPLLCRLIPTAESTETVALVTASTPLGGGESMAATIPGTTADEIKDICAHLGPAAAPDEIGRLGGYRILRVLGTGGMGVVFLAEDLNLQRQVALKVVRPGLASQPGAHERFLREARAAAAVKHERIVTIYQVGTENGLPFMAMELLEGETLSERLDREPPLVTSDVLRIGRQIAEGLAAAHQRGLIHRDIKPGNVWLEGSHLVERNDYKVKLLDFGLARLAAGDVELTATGTILGTPAYMAPEQAKGETVDARADMFSLGVILYRLCTGVLPFKGKDTLSTLMALATHTPARPRAMNPAIPAALSDLVMRLLEKEPAQRTVSAQDVVAVLEAIEREAAASHGETKVSPADRAPPSSNRRLPLLAGAGSLAVLLAGIVLYWQTRHGTVRIEINDPSITAQIDSDGATILRGNQGPIRLEPGTHGLRIKQGDVEFETIQFVLTKGQATTLKVELLTGMVQVVDANGQTIGTAKPRAPPEVVAHDGRPLNPPAPLTASKYGLDFNVDLTNTQLKGNPRIELPEPVRLDGPLTVEMYLTLHDIERARNQLLFGASGLLQLCTWKHELKWNGGAQPASEKPYAYGRSVMQPGIRRHVAVSSDGKAVRLFLDGSLVAEGTMPDSIPKGEHADGRTFIGGHPWRGGDWLPLNGIIDEVRVSTVPRYDKPFTPPARLTADSNTYLLYDLSEGQGDLAHDSSGNGRHGKIVGAKWVRLDAPGASATTETQLSSAKFGLDFNTRTADGSSPHAKLKYVTDASKPLTVEMFITPRSQCVDNMNRLVLGAGSRLMLKQTARGWQWHGPDLNDSIASMRDVPLRRVHLAAVSADEELRLFENGKLVGRRKLTSPIEPGLLNCTLGAQVKTPIPRWEPLDAVIDEFRWSTIARYDRDFTPPERLTADEWTLILHDFNDGAGNVLRDSSGNNHHGTIVGARWVRIDDRGVPAAVGVAETPRYALDFSTPLPQGQPRVEMPKVFNPSDHYTAEMFVTQHPGGTVNRTLFEVNGGCLLKVWGEGNVDFAGPEVGEIDRKRHVVATNGLPPGKRTHLAAVSDGKQVSLFVDGRWIGSAPQEEALLRESSHFGVLGGRVNQVPTWDVFRGAIDGFRYSKTARYKNSFTPPVSFSADPDTLILYDFHEGAGDVLNDVSGNGNHGKIVGARWVRIGGTPIDSAPQADALTSKTDIPPSSVPEPPPLEEWLKGRTILTVAQDGSGQFTTIQAALDALKAGQAVKVLDKGPYRETLRMTDPPADVGLISEAQTIVELTDWKFKKTGAFEYRQGHTIRGARGFRLSGFGFAAATDTTQNPHQMVLFEASSGVVIEDCAARFTDTDPRERFYLQAFALSGFGAEVNQLSVIRDCVVEGKLSATCWTKSIAAPVLFTRNLIRVRNGGCGIMVQGWVRKAFITRNVLVVPPASSGIQFLISPENTAFEAIEVAHNTMVGLGANQFKLLAPAGEVTIRNNVMSAFELVDGAEKYESVTGKWQISQNWYHIRPESLQASTALAFHRPDDPLVEPRFLAEDVGSPNFGRLAAIDGVPHAGALPAGAAPPEGDWFTRLRDRWLNKLPTQAALARPLKPDEPPPLEEWLKGRTVRTVAQDGSGDFKTIQAALEAVKPGEVVRVLDKGPYRESLNLTRPPENIGLVSDQQTILEVPTWATYKNESSRFEYRHGHQIFHARGFRLSGFSISAAISSPEFPHVALYFQGSGGVTIEDCRINLVEPQSSTSRNHSAIRYNGFGSDATQSTVVRDCVMNGGVNVIGWNGMPGAPVWLLRNFIQIGNLAQSVSISGPLRKVFVYNNVLLGSLDSIGFALTHRHTGPPEIIDISNNTVIGSGYNLIFETSPAGGVTIRNNVLAAFQLKDGAEANRSAVDKWQVAGNWYPIRPESLPNTEEYVFRRPDDPFIEPKFLSVNPQDPNFARLEAAGNQVHAGALPAGPAPPGGDWFTRLQERWLNATPTQAALAPPLTLDEPPPLDEWLKGRKILTVAQDGSGQFKTIQAALDALQPGQVVKVLDAGPYYEQLTLKSAPEDCGLISDARCVVDLQELKPSGGKSSDGVATYYAHLFTDIAGFRINGLHFVFPAAEEQANSPKGFACGGCTFARASGVVLENCRFEGRCAAPTWDSVAFVFVKNGGLQPCVVRDCVIEGGLRSDSEQMPGSLLVTRNYLSKVSQNPRAGLKLFGAAYDRVIIRQNILDGASTGRDLEFAFNGRFGTLEISNNLLTTIRPMKASRSVPTGRVVIQNNLCTKPGMIDLQQVTQEQQGEAMRTWQVTHNSYPRPFDASDGATPFPQGAGDVAARVAFLSYDPAHPDYLRLPAESPLATAGAGNGRPGYIGPLPPGPTPPEGDWFSRLRERWLNPGTDRTSLASPLQVPEPPPLDEWLKGRTILTVAQDGSGQFKTIQAALDALKPGQVVKVLDKGPYRESIRLTRPPADVGLITQQQTVLENADWVEYLDSTGTKFRQAHQIQFATGFRLSGFTVVGAPVSQQIHMAVCFEGSSGVTIEDCMFRPLAAGAPPSEVVMAIRLNGFGRDATQPTVVRECVLDGGLGVHAWPGVPAAPVLILRNFSPTPGPSHFYLISGPQRRVYVRNNVIVSSPDVTALAIEHRGDIAPEVIEIAKNTVIGPGSMRFQKTAPAGVILRNNVMPALQLKSGAEADRSALDNWQIANNWYPIRPESLPNSENRVFRRPDDPLVEPRFLSADIGDANFARVAPVPGHEPAGALPPGPAPKGGDWFTRLRERWQPRPQEGPAAKASAPK